MQAKASKEICQLYGIIFLIFLIRTIFLFKYSLLFVASFVVHQKLNMGVWKRKEKKNNMKQVANIPCIYSYVFI